MTIYNKYIKRKKQYSTDGGQTWKDVTPEEFEIGALIEEKSLDCNDVIYQWVDEGEVCTDIEVPDNTKAIIVTKDYGIKFVPTNGQNTLISTELTNTVYDKKQYVAVWIFDMVNEIGNECFSYMTEMKFVHLPKSLTRIDSLAFQNCGIKELNIPKSLSTIDYSAFRDCFNLETITVASGNPYYHLESKSLASGTTLVVGCNGETSITSNITNIASYAFSGRTLGNTLRISNSVTVTGDEAFRSCKGRSVVFESGNGTIAVGSEMFNNATISNYSLGDRFGTFGRYMFAGQPNISMFTITSAVPRFVDSTVFQGSMIELLEVPEEYLWDYESEFKGIADRIRSY